MVICVIGFRYYHIGNFGFAAGAPHIGENDMKSANSLFLITVRRLHLLSDIRKLLLCFLILIGVGLITGCDRDIEDLSKQTLSISLLTPDKETLHLNEITKVKAQVNYSDDATELLYRWMAEKGEIHNHKLPNRPKKEREWLWLKLKKKEGSVTVDIEATYIAPEKTDKKEDIDKITFEVWNKGIKASLVTKVSIVNPSLPIPTSNTTGTTDGNDEESENDETNP